MIKYILHAEGLCLFLAALWVYNSIGGNWAMFLLLLLTPDISMIGYVKNKKYGALLYNLMHNYCTALIIIGIGFFLSNLFIISLGLILFAHVAMDRALGFGLKYPTGFKHTHMQKV